MNDVEGMSINELIERSSLGTPEAKAIRARTPPAVAHAIVLASGYLRRAEEAEAERDLLRARLRWLRRAYRKLHEDRRHLQEQVADLWAEVF